MVSTLWDVGPRCRRHALAVAWLTCGRRAGWTRCIEPSGAASRSNHCKVRRGPRHARERRTCCPSMPQRGSSAPAAPERGGSSPCGARHGSFASGHGSFASVGKQIIRACGAQDDTPLPALRKGKGKDLHADDRRAHCTICQASRGPTVPKSCKPYHLVTSRIPHPASRISHPASRIPHPASRIPHPASRPYGTRTKNTSVRPDPCMSDVNIA